MFPKQVKYIIGNEACERFSFYGMKSLLMVYMMQGLCLTPETATIINHLFVTINYTTPLLGGWIADKFLGRYKTILFISLFYCLGHALLACSDLIHIEAFSQLLQGLGLSHLDYKTYVLYSGLFIIALGSGGIKPCVSTFMGDQFDPHDRANLQKAYSVFYWSINIGSFFAMLSIPAIRNAYGYAWAFGVPGMLMALATLIFWLGSKKYVKRLPQNAGHQHHSHVFKVLGHALASKLSGKQAWQSCQQRFDAQSVDEAKGILSVLSIFAFIPAFWALFDQTSSTWVAQGTQMQPFSIFGYTIVAEQFQSANPLMVMLLIPLLTILVYPYIGKFGTPLKRIGSGFFLAASAFVLVAIIQHYLDNGHQVSLLWQLLPYIVLTLGEVLLSTTGLEFAFTQAPASMKSTVTSMWNLTVALGSVYVIGITKFMSLLFPGSDLISAERFLIYAAITFSVFVAYVFVARKYKYRD